MDERLHQLPTENVVTAVASDAQLDFLLTNDDQLAVALCFADHLGSNYRVLLDLAQCEMLYAGLKSLSGMTPDQLAAAIAELKAAYEADQ